MTNEKKNNNNNNNNDNNNNNKYSLPFNTITLHSKIISDRCRSPGGRSYQLGVYVRPSVCLSLRTQEEKHLKKKINKTTLNNNQKKNYNNKQKKQTRASASAAYNSPLYKYNNFFKRVI